MRKMIFILLVFCAYSGFAQRLVTSKVSHLLEIHTVFKPVMPLTASVKRCADADLLVNDATYAQLDTVITAGIFNEKPKHIELRLPYGHTTIPILLYRVDITAEGFHIDTDRRQNVAYTQGAYYRGIVKGKPNSVAAFSFFENQLYGIVSAGEIGNVVVGRLNIPGNISDYVSYSDLMLKQPQHFDCVTSGRSPFTPGSLPKSGLDSQSEKCVSLYFELRHNAYEANGNDVTQTVNWFTALFNNVQTLFENDGITIAMKSVYVWEGDDPYDMAPPSAYDVLDQFAALTPVFDGDAGQLIHYGGGMGLAYDVGALCSNVNRSFAMVNPFYQPLPAFSGGVYIVAHELGHTLGSQHTHGCYWNGNNTAIDGCATGEGDCQPGPIPTDVEGATIMSYCGNVNFANGFGPQPAARILQHIAASQCLGTDCTASCINSISALKLVDVTESSATLAWEDAIGSDWEIGYSAFGSEVTNWQEISEDYFTVEGLQPNTYYTFSVRNACNAGISPGSLSLSFNTGADWCEGAFWTDTGGDDGDYTSQRTISIIKPMQQGQAVSVTFEDFFTQLQDIVYVYNGIGTSAPLLGTWSGYVSPQEPFTSTDASGALTFEFITNTGTSPSEGWIASVSCGIMSLEGNSFSGLSYYPNPVKDKLSVSFPNGLVSVALYNVTGQLLIAVPGSNNPVTIDMEAYAAGIYILELKNASAHYVKIVKQ